MLPATLGTLTLSDYPFQLRIDVRIRGIIAVFLVVLILVIGALVGVLASGGLLPELVQLGLGVGLRGGPNPGINIVLHVEVLLDGEEVAALEGEVADAAALPAGAAGLVGVGAGDAGEREEALEAGIGVVGGGGGGGGGRSGGGWGGCGGGVGGGGVGGDGGGGRLMPWVCNAALLWTRLLAGMRTRPAVAGILPRRR
uniref:Uncharacterized protein n=1 Tax=Oryza rufipogon TaxID=4529 RepID=A0A0E0QMP2_ORYRU